MRHRRTDPACIRFRQPTNRLSMWWFNRGRGRGCHVCVPPFTTLAAFYELLKGRDE